jgi:ketosteroid isomerase-like protein
MTPTEAKAFAEEHCAVWNSHDLDRILDLYADDVELASPLAAQLTGGGVVRGRDGLRDYFGGALGKYPDLRFTLVNTLLCVDSVVLYFTSISDQLVADVLFLNPDGKIQKVYAHYAC